MSKNRMSGLDGGGGGGRRWDRKHNVQHINRAALTYWPM